MKTFPWLLTAAFALLCYGCWLTAAPLISYVHHMSQGHFINAQVLFIDLKKCVLFLPLPWIVYSVVLTKRRELNLAAVLTFAGTIAIAVALLVVTFAFLAVTSVTPSYGIILDAPR